MEENIYKAVHEVGDVVRFKAGGPTMIVIRLIDNTEPLAKCEWFDTKGHLQDDTFFHFQLIKTEI